MECSLQYLTTLISDHPDFWPESPQFRLLPLRNSPSTDLLTLVWATKSPAAFAVFRLESTLSLLL